MKSRMMITLIASVFLLLSGCRVEMATELPERKPKPSGIRIEMTGTVLLEEKQVVVEGQTDLPEDAILFAGLKEYGDYESYPRILNWQAEEGEEYVTESTGKVGKNGTFQITVDRVDPEKRYKLEVLFNPAIQPSKVQEVFGIWGENIAPTIGMTDFEYNENILTGFIKIAPIMNITDNGGLDSKWNLTNIFGEKSRPIQ
ncbi:hypothetical protein QTG56_21980 [Rossellomorea sp. AcN35-11]|nr:hypothetical protein [Rossellomorea aquimaris]WJV29551.1 hypothetical protein QTG56_21980 [Rossellomorea sp. AcN35-11]